MVNRVKQIIGLKKLTSSHFADRIGVPRSTISHILSGRNKPSLEVAQKILEAFPDISTEWLIKGTGSIGQSASTLFENYENSQQPPNEPESKDQIVNYDEDNTAEISLPGNSPDQIKNIEESDRREEMDSNSQNSKKNKHVIASESFKQSVKIIIMYSDGSYTEHSRAPGY